MRSLLCAATTLYVVAILARILLSWFPLAPGGVMSRVNGALVTVTDPVLTPLRRILPATPPLDLSPIVAVLLLQIVVRGLILRC